MALAVSLPVSAHDVLATYVQHNVRLIITGPQIDLTLELTFFEEWSARERREMDTNSDGRITRAELDRYCEKIGAQLADQVQLRIAGPRVELVPLYEPEIDLLGDDKVGPAHHRLRLSFFVVTPVALRPNDELILEDRLWPEAMGLITMQSEGRDGGLVEAERPKDPTLAPTSVGEVRRFKFRCLSSPQSTVHKSTVPPEVKVETPEPHGKIL